MSYIVNFTNVGRAKASFSVKVDDLDDMAIYRAVRKHLASREVDILADPDTNKGVVVVGGFRQVGEFTYTTDPPHASS